MEKAFGQRPLVMVCHPEPWQSHGEGPYESHKASTPQRGTPLLHAP